MKKFFGNLYLFLAVLLISLVAIPWNDFSVWGLDFSFLSLLRNNEFYGKGGIVLFFFIFSLIFLLVANSEYKKSGKASNTVAYASLMPLMAVVVAYLLHIGFQAYSDVDLAAGIDFTNIKIIVLAVALAFIILMAIFAHLFLRIFKRAGNGSRLVLIIFFFILAAGLAYGARYYRFTYMSNYGALNPYYMAIVVPVALILYLLHIIVIHKKSSANVDEDVMYRDEVDEVELGEDGLITSKSSQVEPKQEMYQEVNVDPEFSSQKKQRSKPNSIEYYIDKPKMFKPLNPTFDKLVNHVKDFPDVIVKSDEEKITFYLFRRPFLVLMNYGDYYRIAFRDELEEGIRLIIKYPTISKNKSTRDELWFKANNYGDLPKEIIYKIVKQAYDVVAK